MAQVQGCLKLGCQHAGQIWNLSLLHCGDDVKDASG
jgi:hypothetical protein